MNIAILKDKNVTNTVVFDNFETAQEFFNNGVWPDTDDIMELPEGYGIGDSYIDGEWIKAPQPELPEPEPEPELEPTEERLAIEILLGVHDDDLN